MPSEKFRTPFILKQAKNTFVNCWHDQKSTSPKLNPFYDKIKHEFTEEPRRIFHMLATRHVNITHANYESVRTISKSKRRDTEPLLFPERNEHVNGVLSQVD